MFLPWLRGWRQRWLLQRGGAVVRCRWMREGWTRLEEAALLLVSREREEGWSNGGWRNCSEDDERWTRMMQVRTIAVGASFTVARWCRPVVSGFHGWLRCCYCEMMMERVQARESARERWWSCRCCSEQVLQWPWCRLMDDGGGCVFANLWRVLV